MIKISRKKYIIYYSPATLNFYIFGKEPQRCNIYCLVHMNNLYPKKMICIKQIRTIYVSLKGIPEYFGDGQKI